MDDQFKIYISHLNEGKTEEIAFEADQGFMDVDEPILKFPYPVVITGRAYVASDELILQLSAKTKAVVPCSLCNEPITVDIRSKDAYSTVPLSEIRGGIYDFREAVRENLLIETPDFLECHGGKCPQRGALKQYIKEPKEQSEDEGQRPFANL